MNKADPNKFKKQRAIDGFLASGPRRPNIASVNKQANSSSTLNGNHLDDFKKRDGFTGRANPVLSTGGKFADFPLNNKHPLNNINPNNDLNVRPKKRKRLRLKPFLYAFIVVLILALGTGGYVFGKAWWSAHKVFRGGTKTALAFDKNIDPHLLNGEGDGRVNILLMGKGGATESDGGELTDSIMIASLDPINTGVMLLSVPRDLWVKPDGLWPMKINAVYEFAKQKALADNPNDKDGAETAGINKLSAVVEQYMGLHMHYYGLIDFSAFQESVDTLGGIDVNLPEAYSDYTMLVGNKYLNLPAGPQHLDGGMALAYARSRHGAARGDFDRGEHQQTVLVGIKDKALSLGTFSNPIKVTQLLNTFGNRVRTNLSLDDMMRIYNLSKQLNNTNIGHADLAQLPNPVVTTSTVGDQSVVIPKAGIDDFSEVKAFVRTQLKDGFLIKENPSVIVLNGTETAGLAQKRADELKGYGYIVVKVADSPVKNLTSTQLIDQTNGAKKYTKRYLEQRFNTTAVDSLSGIDLSQNVADFVIVIGPQG